jgi:hypothetical protein
MKMSKLDIDLYTYIVYCHILESDKHAMKKSKQGAYMKMPYTAKTSYKNI